MSYIDAWVIMDYLHRKSSDFYGKSTFLSLVYVMLCYVCYTSELGRERRRISRIKKDPAVRWWGWCLCWCWCWCGCFCWCWWRAPGGHLSGCSGPSISSGWGHCWLDNFFWMTLVLMLTVDVPAVAGADADADACEEHLGGGGPSISAGSGHFQ